MTNYHQTRPVLTGKKKIRFRISSGGRLAVALDAKSAADLIYGYVKAAHDEAMARDAADRAHAWCLAATGEGESLDGGSFLVSTFVPDPSRIPKKTVA